MSWYVDLGFRGGSRRWWDRSRVEGESGSGGGSILSRAKDKKLAEQAKYQKIVLIESSYGGKLVRPIHLREQRPMIDDDGDDDHFIIIIVI